MKDTSYENLKIEMEKIKGAVERLRAEISQEKLNRNLCKSILLELKTSIEKLTSMRIGFDENWATAACYLSAMEIVVNKKME